MAKIPIGMICVSKFSKILTNKNYFGFGLLAAELHFTMPEGKRIKLCKVVCDHCKVKLMIRSTEKECPVWGKPLPQLK